jgi:hypothetical protein
VISVDSWTAGRFDGAPVLWPSRFDWLAAFAVAVVVFALEAYVATAIGRTQSLAYDGLGYAAQARVQYFQLGNLLHHPVQYLYGFLNSIAGLWLAFLVLTFAIAGVGEVQAYLSWFWPVFFLLALVIWLVRTVADRTIAVLLAVCTALLPLCSPMLALAVSYRLSFDWLDVMVANLADCRPDPMAHVFMLWSVVPLLLHGRDARVTTFLVTAAAAAASVLTKGTTAPLAIGCWGLAALYVCWLQRDRLRQVMVWAAVGGLTLLALLLPWVAAGGLRSVLNYVREAYAWKPFYEQSVTEAGLHHFPFYRYLLAAGLFFSWPVIGLMTLIGAWGTFRAWQDRDRTVVVLLGGLALLAAGILLPLYVQKLRNHYLGMPLYYVLWLYVVVSAAFLWRSWSSIKPFRTAVSGSLATGCVAVAVTGLFGAWTWPQDDLQRLLEGRRLIRQIAADVKKQLTPRDTFAGLVLASGWPLILQYHMTTDATGYPAIFRISIPDGPAIAGEPEARQRFIADLERQAKLIVTFKEAPEEIYKQARMSDFFLPHFNAIHEYLNSSRSRFRPVREYVFPEPGRLFFPPAAGTVVIYLRDDVPQRF